MARAHANLIFEAFNRNKNYLSRNGAVFSENKKGKCVRESWKSEFFKIGKFIFFNFNVTFNLNRRSFNTMTNNSTKLYESHRYNYEGNSNIKKIPRAWKTHV